MIGEYFGKLERQLGSFPLAVAVKTTTERVDLETTSEGTLISRWDNAPHHPEVDTFPHHLHVGKEIQASEPMSLGEVLGEIARHLRSGEASEG